MDNRKVYFYPDSGLGNRLSCIYSAIYMSWVIGIECEILWELESHCNVKWNNLFSSSSSVKVKEFTTLGYKKSPLKTFLGKWFLSRIKKKWKYISSEECQNIYQAGGEQAIIELIKNYNGKMCIKSFSFFADLEHIKWASGQISPAEAINNKVNSILDPYSKYLKIGIHIRRTDHVTAISNSPLELFEDKMSELVKGNNEIVFYLSTDDLGVEEYIKNKFPVIPTVKFSNIKSRTTQAGMQDAFVDMLCLSKCERIYGSYGSTFSKMASIIGDIPLEIIKKQELI